MPPRLLFSLMFGFGTVLGEGWDEDGARCGGFDDRAVSAPGSPSTTLSLGVGLRPRIVLACSGGGGSLVSLSLFTKPPNLSMLMLVLDAGTGLQEVSEDERGGIGGQYKYCGIPPLWR